MLKNHASDYRIPHGNYRVVITPQATFRLQSCDQITVRQMITDQMKTFQVRTGFDGIPIKYRCRN
jgi:hypothetical protein